MRQKPRMLKLFGMKMPKPLAVGSVASKALKNKPLALLLAMILLVSLVAVPLAAMAAWSADSEWVWMGDPIVEQESPPTDPDLTQQLDDPNGTTEPGAGNDAGNGYWEYDGAEWRGTPFTAQESAPSDPTLNDENDNPNGKTIAGTGADTGNGSWKYEGAQWFAGSEFTAQESAPSDPTLNDENDNPNGKTIAGTGADTGNGSWKYGGAEWDTGSSLWINGLWTFEGLIDPSTAAWTGGSWTFEGLIDPSTAAWTGGSWTFEGLIDPATEEWRGGSWSWVGNPKSPAGSVPPNPTTGPPIANEPDANGAWIWFGTWNAPSGGGGGGWSPPALPAFTSSKTDPEEKFVDVLYMGLLGRSYDAAGFTYWVEQLESGAMTFAQVAYHFIFGEEVKAQNLTNEQFVTRLYNGLLGRMPDAGGLDFWVAHLGRGVSKEAIFNAFVASVEFAARMTALGLKV